MDNILKTIFICFYCFTANAIAATVIDIRDPFVPVKSIAKASIKRNVSLHKDTPPLKTCWIPLYFTRVKNVVSFITKKGNHILSSAGSINGDKLNNQVWVQDDAKHIAVIRALIKHLDHAIPQFLITAKIINLDRDYQRSLGVLFHAGRKQSSSALNSINEQADTNHFGTFTVTISKFAQNHLLDLQLSALEKQGHATLISNPSLITLNNKPAVIESGAEVPYQQSTASGATSVRFKKAVLRLKVTPQRMPNHHILLHISLNQDKVSALSVQGVPAIQTQQLSTQVIVRNHETIVLGGILETTQSTQTEGIPILDRLPGIGALFQKKTKHIKHQELLIFITPSMMKSLY